MENNNLHEDNNNNNITCNNNLSKEEENDNTNIDNTSIDINDVFDNIVKHHIEYKKPIVIKQEPVIEVITKVINEIKPKKSKKIIKQSKINLDDKNDYDEEYDDTYDNYYD